MTIYLHDIPLPEAQARLVSALQAVGRAGVLEAEEIPLNEQALGRVLAEPVWAKISSPHYHSAAMDGYAVRSSETIGAMPSSPVTLPVHHDAVIPSVHPSNFSMAFYVDTGDPLPSWADAVIPIENVESLSRGTQEVEQTHKEIRIRAAVTPWNHVRTMGEDMVATQLVLPAGHMLRPVDLGAIAACGHTHLHVARRPRVAILPTGTELVPVGQPVQTGDIIEYNSIVLAAQVVCWGGQVTRFPITPDDYEQICSMVKLAAQNHDLILLNAGSSAGSEDFSARVVESLGDLLVHGVAVRPGHPVILGMIKNQSSEIPIIGVPGYPVSAALTGEIFVEPLLARWLGRRVAEPIIIKASLTRKITSPPGDDDYMRVAVGKVGGRTLAAPLARGAGVITSLVRADGLALIPRGVQGLPGGSEVQVRLYCSPAQIERTIFAIGSHDIILDIMAQFLAAHDRRLASANVGSLGGLVALQRGEAHLAGAHLLDPHSGEYNVSYIHQYLAGTPVRLLALVGRQQGLMVPKGNPKRIRSLHDLVRPDVNFVNRQRGAGTRVLLDYHLTKLGIEPHLIQGYNQEEFTHLSVAAAVASNRADCGLGIASAAQALDLDYVPLYAERYDLVIPLEFCRSELLAPFFEVLAEPTFRQAVANLPGYDTSIMGTIIAEFN